MNKPDQNEQKQAFMRIYSVLHVLQISRSTWLAGVARGDYPKPYRLSPRTVAWKTSDIEELVAKLGGE